MAERLRCWRREEAKRKWHDKVTASARAASEKSREKQQLLAAEAKGLAKIPEDSKRKAQRVSISHSCSCNSVQGEGQQQVKRTDGNPPLQCCFRAACFGSLLLCL